MNMIIQVGMEKALEVALEHHTDMEKMNMAIMEVGMRIMDKRMMNTEKALEVALEHLMDMVKALLMGTNMDIQTDGKMRMRAGRRQVARGAGRMNDGNTSIIRKATMRR